MAQRYTDAQVASALATLELNGGNVKRTSVGLGIPRPTLIMWRDKVNTAVSGPKLTLTASPERPSRDYAELWGGVQELAIDRLSVIIPTCDDVRDVAYAAGIAADKHLNYRDGRTGTGATVNVDARQVRIVYQDQRQLPSGDPAP